MRKYAISRRSVVTTAHVKAVNVNTFEVVDVDVALEGAFDGNAAALKAVQKNWDNTEYSPINVTGLSCKVRTYGMTAAKWFDTADLINEEDISPEDAANFGKRKSSAPSEQ